MSFLESLDVAKILIQFAVLLFALSIHEASHAWTADYFGDYTARYLGRVTINPIAHIDPIGTILFPILMFATGFPLIGWAKPVPVNPAHLRNPRRDQILVSLAGPGSNLVAAVASFGILCGLKLAHPHAAALVDSITYSFAVPREQSVLAPLVAILFFSLIINLALALFNVLPIPPLDGHWLLYGILPAAAARVLERASAFGFILLYALMFLGVFSFIFVPIRHVLGLLAAV